MISGGSDAIVTVGGQVLAAAIVVALSTLGARQPPSISDGIYTAEQANRGGVVYRKACESCHAPDLSGGKVVPGLSGSAFSEKWSGVTLGQWFDLVLTSMPDGSPAEVTSREKADILAFVLRESGLPPGDVELPDRTEVLDAYTFGTDELAIH